jgi:hypothetical protein
MANFISERCVPISQPCKLSAPRITQPKWTFCHWTAEQPLLVEHILFHDEAPVMRDVISTCHNSYVWSPNKPHHANANNFQCHFSVNMWCGLTGYQLIKPPVSSQATLYMWLQHFTSFQLRSYMVAELVLWKFLDWSWRFTCLATTFIRLDTLWFLLKGIHRICI